jgi:hypothetical protein
MKKVPQSRFQASGGSRRGQPEHIYAITPILLPLEPFYRAAPDMACRPAREALTLPGACSSPMPF